VAYVKLDTGILNSTLWIDRDCRELFITALLMAEPREFSEPIPQIKVDALDFTGWSAPPGWYGYVPAAGVGIIARCGIKRELGMAALIRLGSAENDSRNPQFEGRRMIRMDGGYVILNYMRYRDKDHTAAKRQQALRDRRKAAEANENVTRDGVTSRRDVALPSRNVTQSDADADAKSLRLQNQRASKTLRETVTEKIPQFSTLVGKLTCP
jgi:hypothetical protein